MTRYIVAIIFTLLYSSLFGQFSENKSLIARNKIDSFNRIIVKSKNDTSKIINLTQTTYWYDDMLKYDSSIINLEKALYLAKEINYAKGIKGAMLLLGQHYIYINKDVKGLSLCLELMKIAEKNADTLFLIDVYRTIGFLSRKMKDYKQNLFYQKKALSLYLSKSLDSISSIAYNNVGDAYMQLEQFDSANFYFQKGVDVAIKHTHKYGIALSNLNLGELNYKTKNYDLSVAYLRRSLLLFKKIDGMDKIEACLDLANLFKEINKMDSVIFYARKSYKSSCLVGFTEGVLESATLQADFYYSTKNIDSAFKYQKILIGLKDSLFNVEKTREIENLIIDEALRQNEIIEKEKQVKEERYHNLQLGAIALFILIFIMIVLILSNQKSSNRAITFLGVLSLLMLFEFINLLIHPYLEKLTNHNPALMLFILVLVGVLLVPLHHKLEHWIKKQIEINIAKHKRRLALIEKAKEIEKEGKDTV